MGVRSSQVIQSTSPDIQSTSTSNPEDGSLSAPEQTWSKIVPMEESSTKIVRPSCTDLFAVKSPRNSVICQSKLRPKKEENPTENLAIKDFNFEEEENGIIQLSKMTILFQNFSQHYLCKSMCKKPNPKVVCAGRKGLALSCKCVCTNCKFQTPVVQMYQECRIGSRGPASNTINEGLLIAAVKSKVGPSDLSCILSCINVKPPSSALMHRKFTRTCDIMTQINENSMLQNQQYVKSYCEASGLHHGVAVETDTSFNNRIQAGYEAGTSSVTPMIEQTTGLALPLAVTVYNKICSQPNCTHTTEHNCKKNYPSNESMSSSEKKAFIQNFENIQKNNIINVTSVTSDASAQLGKVITEHNERSGSRSKVDHQLCLVHRMRTLQKNIKKVRLASVPVRACDRDSYMQRLAYCIRIRARMEIGKSYASFPTNQFVVRSSYALRNIVSCFCGNHTMCSQRSLVCRAHLKSYNTAHLPLGQHLTLTDDGE
ncbi:hypothetical protein FSP39_016009 [Pinctada imbricata]|uniref:Mutator-like transposase domain-containing protein n=1 Tax=Pinctada imbricata TaxID=66713 RepID=A0AA88YT98_PINIB|nr:hypothetical protein FSP39_016009 [Pinctada imbricata]